MRILSYAILLGSLLVLAPASTRALDAKELPNAVENAKTAADHEAIAVYFDEQAKAALAEAKEHRRMGAVYEKHRGLGGTKAAHSPLNKTMPPHCDRLATDYEAAAKEY